MIPTYFRMLPLLLLVLACQSKSDEEVQPGSVNSTPPLDVNYLNSFLDLENAGLIWGESIGKVVTKRKEGNRLTVDVILQNADALQVEGEVSQRKFTGAIGPFSFRFRFNSDGSGFGQSDNGRSIYTLPGRLTDWEKVLEDFDQAGINAAAQQLMQEIEFPAESADAVYWHMPSDQYIEVTYIFPIGNVSPRIRILTFRKNKGVWSGEEAISKYD